MIKNNHIEAAGGVRPSRSSALSDRPAVEIEVRTPSELDQALAAAQAPIARQPDAAPGRRTDSLHRGARHGGTVGRHHARDHPRIRQSGRRFHFCGAITHSATAVDINFRLEA